ncbi:Na(+)-translocating NADH-quinone reductase subunit C [Mariniblastus fucicola]|uniref:Na(+)-translocating NADH-quinone reductase subunit C n=1 Tax=Mariniblastus fucicola TaxID=980251 RepID=A0A5B9PB30_9BACT|nr:Na(+)-translocating NADH-quinone reductase subunit C [Mariniblastus fucicola]QEG22132.1 Na(+)-translocating NADH-quinone reductase subunit C [Mariniblastus fucicola]
MPLENLKKNKDNPINTAIVAGALCLVCALIVSTAASSLKTIQEDNIAIDRKKNLLAVTKFPAESMADSQSILDTFEKNFTTIIIDMETGEEAPDEALKAMQSIGKTWDTKDELEKKYDQFTIAKTKRDAVADEITGEDKANIKYREKYSFVYILNDSDGNPKTYVFPVRGYGLWSMMHGYLAVKPDFQTIEGLVFYDQAETPGLGGEVKSEKFKSQWPGKEIYGEDGEVQIKVIKNADTSYKHAVDALSGATITSNGVTYALEYWLGPEGFKPFIERRKASSGSSDTADQETGVGNG